MIPSRPATEKAGVRAGRGDRPCNLESLGSNSRAVPDGTCMGIGQPVPRARVLTMPAQLPPRPKFRSLSWSTPTSTLSMNHWSRWRGWGASYVFKTIGSRMIQDNNRGKWEESQWGFSVDGVAKARGLKQDQWVPCSEVKTCGQKGALWDTMSYTIASTIRLFFFQQRLQGWKADTREQGDEWNRGAWCKIYKEPVS